MVPDRFDPLMDIGTAKSKGDYTPPAIPTGGTGANPMADYFDSTANFGTNGHDVVFGQFTNPLSTDGVQRQPADVDKFGGD